MSALAQGAPRADSASPTPDPSDDASAGASAGEPSPLVAALQAALEAEYAAAYGYGVVGAHSRGGDRTRAADALAWHRLQATRLRVELAAAGGPAVSPEPGYVLPFSVTSATAAARLGDTIEQRVANAYGDLVAAASGSARVDAAAAMSACAVRSFQWTGRTEPFPGLAERR